MKTLLCCLLCAPLTAGAVLLHPAAPVVQVSCGGDAPSGDSGPPPKPSSFAPRPASSNRAYGAPIQRPILHKRARRKTASTPQG
jgi:hypothetical protein